MGECLREGEVMVMEKELKDKVRKYRKLTEKALGIIKVNEENNEKEKLIAEDFLSMARNYLSDGKFYEEKGDFGTALAAFSYAHAWLDAGVRAGIFWQND